MSSPLHAAQPSPFSEIKRRLDLLTADIQAILDADAPPPENQEVPETDITPSENVGDDETDMEESVIASDPGEDFRDPPSPGHPSQGQQQDTTAQLVERIEALEQRAAQPAPARPARTPGWQAARPLPTRGSAADIDRMTVDELAAYGENVMAPADEAGRDI